jgi:CBS-domain-containing membrane protein
MQVAEALGPLLEAKLPALPVVGDDNRFCGIFGEREFITAIFPGDVKNLGYAAFVPKSPEAAIEKRQACRHEPVRQHMNREHIDVLTDFSDLQLAEIFIPPPRADHPRHRPWTRLRHRHAHPTSSARSPSAS